LLIGSINRLANELLLTNWINDIKFNRLVSELISINKLIIKFVKWMWRNVNGGVLPHHWQLNHFEKIYTK